MSDKPLKNECAVFFSCQNIQSCVYRKGVKGQNCKYHSGGVLCYSTVAQANAMVLALKDMGFEVELKGGKP